MSQLTNSGKYINYVDARSSSCAAGVIFSSANCESLSSIVRNNSFYSEKTLHPIQIKAQDAYKDDSGKG